MVARATIRAEDFADPTWNPLLFAAEFWPHVKFYSKQIEVIESFVHNDETVVPAGNMLGKDFVSGFLNLWFFLTRHPVRCITTSAKDDHLRVLWGEIGRFIDTCKYSLNVKKGGPLLVHHQDVSKIVAGEKCKLSYLKGLVASEEAEAAMGGHHIAKTGDGIPRTSFTIDEASSVRDAYHRIGSTWANRVLILGNTWPCRNFFYRAVKGKAGSRDSGGDRPRPPSRGGYYRKVVKIQATDSPNIRLALAQIAQGKEPTREMLVPGVKDFEEYEKNLSEWDDATKAVSLWAEFWEGKDARLFPDDWIDNSCDQHRRMRRGEFRTLPEKRNARGVGVDPANDRYSMAAVDEWGLIKLVTEKIGTTTVIPKRIRDFCGDYKCPPGRRGIDLGDGKPHADACRQMKFPIRTVAFGGSPSARKRSRGVEALSDEDARKLYLNLRAQMYHEWRMLMDPSRPIVEEVVRQAEREEHPERPLVEPEKHVFAIPGEEHGDVYAELIRQMAVVPFLRTNNGRIWMLPKRKVKGENKHEECLESLLGCSPDEMDAVAIAVHCMLHPEDVVLAGTRG